MTVRLCLYGGDLTHPMLGSNNIRSLRPLPPPKYGHMEFIGAPPPLMEIKEEIPYLHTLATEDAKREEMESLLLSDDYDAYRHVVPEFTYPDLPPPGLQGLVTNHASVNYHTFHRHETSHPHTPIDAIDPQLGFAGPFRNGGNGASTALGELQHMPEGSSHHPFFFPPPPGTPMGPSRQYEHNPFGHDDEHDETRDAEGEFDNGWNSNIIYSFGEDGNAIFNGDDHNNNIDIIKKAVDAGLQANGVSALWHSSTGNHMGVSEHMLSCLRLLMTLQESSG